MPKQYPALSFVSQTSQDSPQGSRWDPELFDNWHSFNLQSHKSDVLLSQSIYIQSLKPGPDEVINHGYTVSAEESSVLIFKNLEIYTEQQQPVSLCICRHVPQMRSINVILQGRRTSLPAYFQETTSSLPTMS